MCEQTFIVTFDIFAGVRSESIAIVAPTHHFALLILDNLLVDGCSLVSIGFDFGLESVGKETNLTEELHLLILIMEVSESDDLLDHFLHLVDLSELGHQ